MIRKAFSTFIICALAHFSFAQSANHLVSIAKDSIRENSLGEGTLSSIDRAISDSEVGQPLHNEAYFLLVKYHDLKYQDRQTIKAGTSALSVCTNDSMKAEICLLISRACGYTNNLDSGLIYADQGLNLFRTLNDHAGEISMQQQKASMLFNLRQEAQAFENYNTAIKLMSKYNDSTQYMKVQSNAGACLLQLGDYEKAKEYFEKLVAKYPTEKYYMGQVYANLGSTCVKLEQNELAKQNYLKAIPILDSNGFTNLLGAVYFNLIDVYLNLGDVDSSLEYANKALPIYEKAHTARLGLLYGGLGNIYMAKENWGQAETFYKKALAIADKNRDWQAAEAATRDLTELNKIIGNISQALYFSEKHNQYQDSLYDQNKIRAIEEYRIQYEAEQKEQRIKQLEELNNAKSAQLTTRKQNEKLTFAIGLVILFTILLGLFGFYRFRLFKQKQSAETRLSILNNKLVLNRLSPHFMFNVLNSAQYYINANDKLNANRYLSKFSLLLRNFLESISVEFHTLQDELKLLREYVDLQRMLKKDSFEFIEEINEQVDLTAVIPTMLIQPFIENAIEHGTSSEKPWVKLKISVSNDDVICTIEDNGTGINESTSEYRSRGMEISSERLALLNKSSKNNFSLSWRNKTGDESGLIVLLKIPQNF